MERKAGILLPVFSLPSNYGIGTFGEEAYKFVDFLKEAGQSYWQILPLGQTSYGDSPYQSYSSFAGNPYFIDLDLLVKDELLDKKDLKDIKVNNPKYVDYADLYNTRFTILRKAYKNGVDKYMDDFNEFRGAMSSWLHDFALYMAIKHYFNDKCWQDWEDDIRFRKPDAIYKYEILLKEDIEFYEFVQYLFYKQYLKLKEYANSNGIKIIGDIPIYVSLDSSDIWMAPENFQLDENFKPRDVAGVPPDYFTEDGQLWGNPLYDYDYQERNGFEWWINRINGSSMMYDIIRIDHFRGFESYWSVPFGEKTARNGKWVKGPNMRLLNRIKERCQVQFIAEDLGYHTPEVQQMLDDFGYPGMKVLEFGFDGAVNDHAPLYYVRNCICYVGTHDNDTIMGFKKNGLKESVKRATKYLGVKDDRDFNWAFIRAGMSSVADTFVAQIQDYLGLDDSARINTPGLVGNNWKWRLEKGQLSKDLAKKIKEYTCLYGRGE